MNKPELVKCFRGNLDGRREGLIIARSQKQAVRIAGCSLHFFRGYWMAGKFPAGKFEPYTLYTKLYSPYTEEYVKGLCKL